jgi:hypothetical protein
MDFMDARRASCPQRELKEDGMGLWLLTRPLGFVFRPIGLLMRGDFRGLFGLLLGFALLGGLWVTALFSLSTPATATAVMTETGVAVINPTLGSMGVGPAVLATIQEDAVRHPADPVEIPGLKTGAIALTKGDLAGLTFDQATRKIYGNVAKAYYSGGPDAVFTVSVPTVSLLPDSHLDWLAALGLSSATLTAHGHAQTQQLALYLWGAVGVLGLLVLLLSKGWSRLYALSQAIFTGAVPGLALIGVVALLWQHAPGVFTPFAALLHVIGGAIVPIYVGAGVVAVVALIVGALGGAATKTASVAVKGAKSVRRTPVPVGAHRAAAPAGAADSAYRPYNPGTASSASAYSNMGASNRVDPSPAPYQVGGSAAAGGYGQGARYGTSQGFGPGYAQRQENGWGHGQASYGQGYSQSQPYAPIPGTGTASAQPQVPSYGSPYSPPHAATYDEFSGEATWPTAGAPYGQRALLPSGTDGSATDTWLTDQGPQPEQPDERRAHPDYRNY